MCLLQRTFYVASLAILVFSAAADEPEVDAARARHLQRMRELAGSIRVVADPANAKVAVKLQEEPILRYSDSTRKTHESSLWTWTDGGRPTAILAVEYYADHPKGPQWLYEIASLSTELIAAQREENFDWSAKEGGVHFKTFPEAPLPADKAARRLAQMKELRNRFTAFEDASFSGRVELRHLVTPLMRYSKQDEGLIDGAVFALANGTNPEVLIVLEAQMEKQKLAWHYALVHMSGEPANVQLDGEEIWQRDGDAPPAVRTSYINGWMPAQ